MASVATANLSAHEKDELVCSYAALLLQDDGQEVTAEALSKVIKSSGNTVESYWPALFAKALQGQNIAEIIANMSAAPAAAAPSGPAPAGGNAAPAPEPVKKVDEPVDIKLGNVFGDDDEY